MYLTTILMVLKLHLISEPFPHLGMISMVVYCVGDLGRMKCMNCKLTTKKPDYQLGWASWQLNIQKRNFILCSENSPKPTLRVNTINGQSIVPPLRSSLEVTFKGFHLDNYAITIILQKIWSIEF